MIIKVNLSMQVGWRSNSPETRTGQMAVAGEHLSLSSFQMSFMRVQKI